MVIIIFNSQHCFDLFMSLIAQDQYGCEIWSLTRREEKKLRVFENMVLRRIFGPRRDEVTGNGGECITRS